MHIRYIHAFVRDPFSGGDQVQSSNALLCARAVFFVKGAGLNVFECASFSTIVRVSFYFLLRLYLKLIAHKPQTSLAIAIIKLL